MIGDNLKNEIWGGNGNDVISGGGGSDYLSGGSGNDQISGDSGHDKLRGGSGNDVLKGGTGNNLLNGEYGTDTASYAASNVGVLAFTNSHTGSGNGSSIRTDGHDTLLSIENLQGSRFADVLVGGNGANVLQGMNGVDEMEGRGGNDRLDGGRGDDKLWGGSGYDTMTGGDGADTFVFLNNDALDRITDFSVEDVIQLSFHAVGTQWSSAGDVRENATYTSNGDMVIHLGNDAIVLEDFTNSAGLLTNENFIF